MRVYKTAFLSIVATIDKSVLVTYNSDGGIAALDAAIDVIRCDVTSGEVDQACRGVIEKAGLYEKFRKRTGYSIGLAYAPDWG